MHLSNVSLCCACYGTHLMSLRAAGASAWSLVGCGTAVGAGFGGGGADTGSVRSGCRTLCTTLAPANMLPSSTLYINTYCLML